MAVVVDAKASFESISSVYVYSLEPATLQDLNVLADVRQEMLSTYGKDDPLELGAQWGMIQSKTVKVWSRSSWMGV
jgi:DNA polymerase delta subunit 3